MQNRKTRTKATRLASRLARHGEQSILSATTLLAVASKHSSLSQHCSPREQAYSLWRVVTVCCHEKPIFTPKSQFWIPQAQIWFQGLPKRLQTPKEIQNRIKFEPKHFLNKNHHLTHFCKNSQEQSNFTTISMIMITQGSNRQQ